MKNHSAASKSSKKKAAINIFSYYYIPIVYICNYYYLKIENISIEIIKLLNR